MTLKTNALKLLLFLFSAFALLAKEKQKKPNILFIFTDDQSHRTVGCYPESPDWVKTPNIDSLAQNGIRFTNCYMGSWCMGSRATLLTGHQTYGVKSMRMEGEYPGSSYDAQKCPFWPAVFRKKGYQTAQVGKWHTGTDNGFGRDWDFQKVWNRPAFPDNAGNCQKFHMCASRNSVVCFFRRRVPLFSASCPPCSLVGSGSVPW